MGNSESVPDHPKSVAELNEDQLGALVASALDVMTQPDANGVPPPVPTDQKVIEQMRAMLKSTFPDMEGDISEREEECKSILHDLLDKDD